VLKESHGATAVESQASYGRANELSPSGEEKKKRAASKREEEAARK
jgi:hypothetical protein